ASGPGNRSRPVAHRPGHRRGGQSHSVAPPADDEGAGIAGQIGGTDMAIQADTQGQPATAGRNWYARSPEEVTTELGVDVATGLPAARAAELLAANGPNALPEEKPTPGWRRFLDEYRSYMQIILIATTAVSLLVKRWSTAILPFWLTILNEVVGLGQEGKAGRA